MNLVLYGASGPTPADRGLYIHQLIDKYNLYIRQLTDEFSTFYYCLFWPPPRTGSIQNMH
jgi:hypothetical protein